jgi:SAM-dependent methyltransferase
VPQPGTLLDVAGGTGIVSSHLVARGHQVAVSDRIIEILRHMQVRQPGAAVCMDAARLPEADASIDTVTMVWFLHLVPNPEPMIAEAARVLRPGGRLVTTVDKAAAHGEVRDSPSDTRDVVTRLAAGHGLITAGETWFVGVDQCGEPVYTPRIPCAHLNDSEADHAGSQTCSRRRRDGIPAGS